VAGRLSVASRTAGRYGAEALPGMPIVADGDTGYGNPLSLRATVRAYERAGAAAIHIEDQT
jgi:2-methylisocitrate lyase-like PEP mutase family enzyme